MTPNIRREGITQAIGGFCLPPHPAASKYRHTYTVPMYTII